MRDLGGGEYARAVDELRLAAFGLIDDVPRYQTAQVYLAVASSKLGRDTETRVAAEKALHAERVAPSYQRLALDPAVRAQFDALLPKVVAANVLADAPTMTQQIAGRAAVPPASRRDGGVTSRPEASVAKAAPGAPLP